MKKLYTMVVVSLLSLFASPAFAVIDITAATTGIADAETAILAVIAALMAMATGLYGIMMVYRFVNKKSGVN